MLPLLQMLVFSTISERPRVLPTNRGDSLAVITTNWSDYKHRRAHLLGFMLAIHVTNR